jgi:hypothetical protein
MKGFLHFVLEDTLQLTTEASGLREDPRAADCVKLIQEHLDLSLIEYLGGNYEREVRDSVVELQNIALEHCEFLIAVRLREISRLLENVEKANVA